MPTWAQRTLVIVAEAVIGIIATVSIHAAVDSPTARNVSIPIIWGLLIISAAVAVWRLAPAPARARGGGWPKRERLRKALKKINGETLATDASTPNYGLLPPTLGLNITLCLNLRLGELALIRRIAIREFQFLAEPECEEILEASGVKNPRSSVSRLKRSGDIWAPSPDTLMLTDQGKLTVETFSQWLQRDPRLVTMYGKVAIAVNQVIRVDGGMIFPESIRPRMP